MHALPFRAGTAAAMLSLLGGLAAAQDTVVLHETPPITGTLEPSAPGRVILEASGWRVSVLSEDIAAVRPASGPLRIPLADEWEVKALRAEAGGNYRDAIISYTEALQAVLRSARSLDLGAAATVRLHVYLQRLSYFSESYGSPLDLADLATQIVETPGLSPIVRASALHARANALRSLGRPELALADERALGLIDRFYLVGPFDNERGTGFNTAYGPEKLFDPAATFKGKKHTVGWRPQPVSAPPGGEVDLDTLFRPNDQALAYAVTYIHADAAGPVAFRLGSDEAVKLWVNDQRILARKVRRREAPDQDVVGATLAKGWNKVLLKVCDQTGAWSFRLRVTAPDGGPAAGLRVASLKEIAQAPATPSGSKVATVTGAPLTQARSLAMQSGATWREWFHLGYLHLITGAHDETEHPDRDAFQRALTLCRTATRNPNGVQELQSHVNTFLSFANAASGEFSVNREDNARRAALEAAIRIGGGNLRARVLLAGYYANQLGSHDRARQLLGEALEANPRYLDAQLMLWELDARRGLQPLVRARLEGLYETTLAAVQAEQLPALPESLLRDVLEIAQGDGDVRRQERLLEQLLEERRDDPTWLSDLADLQERAGRHDAALTLRRQAIASRPWYGYLRLELAEHLERLTRYDEAAAVLERALEIAPQDDDLVEALGHVQDRRGKTGEADALYRRAMTLNPNRVELAKYLEFRGRKQAKARVRFEDDWAVDPAPLVAKVQGEPLDPRRTHRTLFRQEVARLNDDGTKSEFTQEVFRIENRVGAREMATYSAYFQSDQHIEFQRARVFFRDGRVEDAPVGSSTGRSRGEFTSGRRYPVRFPPLSPGDVIAVRYRTDDLEQGFFGDYYGKSAFFQSQVRMDWVRYVLIAPRGKELHFHTPGLKAEHQRREEGDRIVHLFEQRDVPPLRSERNMPWAKELIPQVQVSTFKDWDAFSRWYWGLVASQHEADDQIKAKVAELTKGAKTVEEKVRRIYNYVVTDIRYNASWEFGIHGFKPYNATKIYARKFGDCKDKATLIGTMCKEVGIKAWPVLIFGEDQRGREDLSLPLMNHFNHCISWVDIEGVEGGMFLDGTAEHHPYATLPTMDYGAKVVVITPEKGVLREIPFRSPEANTIKETHAVQVQPGGKATLQSRYEGTGTYGVLLRDLLELEGRRRETLEPQIGRRFGGAHVQAVRTSDLTNLDLPVEVELDVDLPQILREAPDGTLELRPVRSWLFDAVTLRGQSVAELATDTERTQDLILGVPSGVEETVTYELPPNLRVERLPPQSNTKLDTPFATYELKYTQEGKTVRVERVLRFKTQRIAVKDYEAFRTFLKRVTTIENQRIILRGKGGNQ